MLEKGCLPLPAFNMGKAKKALTEFIDAIPDAKLTGFPGSAGTIWEDPDFRFDMQGVCNLPVSLCWS